MTLDSKAHGLQTSHGFRLPFRGPWKWSIFFSGDFYLVIYERLHAKGSTALVTLQLFYQKGGFTLKNYTQRQKKYTGREPTPKERVTIEG